MDPAFVWFRRCVVSVIALVIFICLTAVQPAFSGWELLGMNRDMGRVVGPASIAIACIGIFVSLVMAGIHSECSER